MKRSQAQKIKQRLGFQYDSNQHLAVYRYSAEEARVLATQRVDNEIAEGMNHGQDLEPSSEEYGDIRTERIDYYCNQLLSEIMLIKKADSTFGQRKRAELLPPTVLWHIDKNLPKSEAEYFLTQYGQYRKLCPGGFDHPATEFYVTQAILEQIVIQKRRDLQTLAGDVIDESLEKGITMALKRWKDLSQRIIKDQANTKSDEQANSGEALKMGRISGQYLDDPFE